MQTVVFQSNSRFSIDPSSGRTYVDRRLGRVTKIQVAQRFDVSSSVKMTTWATLSMADFDLPTTIFAPDEAISGVRSVHLGR